MSIVTRATAEGSAFVQDTAKTPYVDLVLDQTFPGVRVELTARRLEGLRSPKATYL